VRIKIRVSTIKPSTNKQTLDHNNPWRLVELAWIDSFTKLWV